jgi:hypothetical protein
MADVVVDTSTAVKWYIPEQHHEQARALRDDFLNGKHDLCAPALMPFEAVNALNYSGYYDAERLHEAAHSLDTTVSNSSRSGRSAPSRRL